MLAALRSPARAVRSGHLRAPCCGQLVYVVDARLTPHERLATCANHAGDIVAVVAFSPDGTRRSGFSDFALEVRNTDTFAVLVTLITGHTKDVFHVSFSPDGKRIASCSLDETVRLWDSGNGNLQQTLTGHTSSIWSVAFSHDGTRLASGSHDETVRLWDTARGVVHGAQFLPRDLVRVAPDAVRMHP